LNENLHSEYLKIELELQKFKKNNDVNGSYKYLSHLITLSENKNEEYLYLYIIDKLFEIILNAEGLESKLSKETKKIICHYNGTKKYSEHDLILLYSLVPNLIDISETETANNLINLLKIMNKKIIITRPQEMSYYSTRAFAEINFCNESYKDAAKFFLKLTRNFNDSPLLSLEDNIEINLKLYDSLGPISAYKSISRTAILKRTVDMFLDNGITSEYSLFLLDILLGKLTNHSRLYISSFRLMLLRQTYIEDKSEKNSVPSLEVLVNNISKFVHEDNGDTTRAEEMLGFYKEVGLKNKNYNEVADVLYAMYILYDSTDDTEYLVAVCLELFEVLNRFDIVENTNAETMYLHISKSLMENEYLEKGKLGLDKALSLFNKYKIKHIMFLPEYKRNLGFYYSKKNEPKKANSYYIESLEMYKKIHSNASNFELVVTYIYFIENSLDSSCEDEDVIIKMVNNAYESLLKNTDVKPGEFETYLTILALLDLFSLKKKKNNLQKLIKKLFSEEMNF